MCNMNTDTLPIGCYLDNHRGHYITRDVILLAEGFGFKFDGEAHALVADYDDHNCDDDYPFESLVDLCDEAIAWLNENVTARPEDTYWEFNDGDFGIYPAECEECGNGGVTIASGIGGGYVECNRTHWCQNDW